jgi:phosphoribosyl-ATP pyrophosphohydrolase/phosphoribosyl-AMP cyclohydrolase
MAIIDELKYDQNGLIPAIAQDAKTKEVLMVAYMNKESIEKTLKEGKACYWSRSRKKLWTKGETSGHFQKIKEILYDCDMDALLLMVDQTGPACHTGNRTCFFRKLK